MAHNKDARLKGIMASAGRISKRGLRAALLGGAILAPVLGISNIFGKWVYQVKTNYGVVVTQSDGSRVAVDKPGWHSRVPFLSTYEEEYPLANQAVFLHGKTEPHQVVTKEGSTNEGSVIMATAATFYEISDLHQYAVENVKADLNPVGSINPRTMLQQTLDSIVGDQIQRADPKDIIHNRSKIEKVILEALVGSGVSGRYGIRINGFNFTDTSYIPAVVEANAQKQAAVAKAEGEYAAAQLKRKSIETLAEADSKKYRILAQADAERYRLLEKALNPTTPEERKFVQEIFQSLTKYMTMKERVGDTVWVVPESTPVLPVYK